MALIHFPSDVNDKFIDFASSKQCPSLPAMIKKKKCTVTRQLDFAFGERNIRAKKKRKITQ